MDREQVLQAVREAAARLLDADPAALDEATRFAELGADSLAVVELTCDVEEAVGVDLLERESVTGAVTVGGYVDAVLEVG